MDITLRSANDSLIPEAPAVKTEGLIAKTKNDTLTYSEMDNNFGNITKYLKDIAEEVLSLKASTNSATTLKKLQDIQTALENITTKIDLTKDLKKPVSEAVQAELDKKANTDGFKTINSESIIGSGNIEFKTSKTDVLEHLTSIGSGDPGSLGIFDTLTASSFGDILAGSDLYTATGTNVSGSWRQCGNISPTKALFFRIV